MIFAMMVGQ